MIATRSRARSKPRFSSLLASAATHAPCQPVQPVMSLAQKERPALIETLKELCAIESGSSDIEGLDRIAAVIAGRLEALGGKVEMVEADQSTHRQSGTPEKIGKMVRATFTGTGTRKILLLAHMDTVYPRGSLEQQPFRIEGDRAYGLGIADDRHGIAVILHTLAMLNAMKFRDFGTLTVLINGDEEIGSPGSRDLIVRLGAEHDATMSFEGGGPPDMDRVNLATSGSANATITVRGRASHSGSAPHLGINAVDELAHQILQNRDLSDPVDRPEGELHARERRHREEHDPARRTGDAEHPRAAHAGPRRHRAETARAHQEQAAARGAGGASISSAIARRCRRRPSHARSPRTRSRSMRRSARS